jgi:hypothetical protein
VIKLSGPQCLIASQRNDVTPYAEGGYLLLILSLEGDAEMSQSKESPSVTGQYMCQRPLIEITLIW